jgi:LmbE family N-acetylglucosaminyl deacetylase
MGFCVRRLLAAVGILIAALVFSTAPASAHADHHADEVVAQGADHAANAPHRGDADHDVDHNPADHTHPIGENTYHEKASHSSLDFAHHQPIVVKTVGSQRVAVLPFTDRVVHGLEPTPPIRPPLG